MINVKLTLWGEDAKRVEKEFGLETVGDKKSVRARIELESKPAGGKSRVDLNITF